MICGIPLRSFFSRRSSARRDSSPSQGSPASYTPNSSRRMSEEPKILIVGAGAAGVACATRLIESGLKNVLLIEAEPRVGGRINTIPFADNVVDLGAQWCHGEVNNVVFDLASPHDLLASSGNLYVTFECIRSNGEILPAALVERLRQILARIFRERDVDLPTFDGSLDQYLTAKFAAALESEENSDIDRGLAMEFFENFKKLESSESATGLEEVSGCGLVEYWECEGDNLLNWKDKGYAELLRLLMRSGQHDKELGVLDGKVLTNLTVETVKWDREDGIVEVRCEEYGDTFEADHVVVTVSLGVLKERSASMFRPKLPPAKVRAIEGLGYGSVCKIFLEFGEPFWPDEWTGFNTLWRDEDADEMRATSHAWLVDVYGFYCVDCQPRVLLAWIVGASALAMEALPDEEIQDGCMYLLRRFLPWPVPDPLTVLATRWHANPNFRGAYSFRSMVTELMRTSAHALAQPLNVLAYALLPEDADSTESLTKRRLTVKPVIQFAGEATSDHYYSTVHGAVESGWREADRLIGYYAVEI